MLPCWVPISHVYIFEKNKRMNHSLSKENYRYLIVLWHCISRRHWSLSRLVGKNVLAVIGDCKRQYDTGN